LLILFISVDVFVSSAALDFAFLAETTLASLHIINFLVNLGLFFEQEFTLN